MTITISTLKFGRCLSLPCNSSFNYTKPHTSSTNIFSFSSFNFSSKNKIKHTSDTRTIITSSTREMSPSVDSDDTTMLKSGIAEFYDESSGLWEGIWGDHMHHGFYEKNNNNISSTNNASQLSDHRSAQLRMIEESLRFAGLSSDDPMKRPRSIVDVGCGIGGSSRYLAKKYDAECRGITLSPVQAERAQSLANAQGLSDKVSFQVADALNQPFPDGKFDLVWSMESGEHMPEKSKFVNELARVAAPGGTIIIVTWCHRDLSPSEESLKPDETKLLKKICDAFYLPAWCSAADYVKLLESLSLKDIKTEDWSDYVAPFWPAVISTAFTWKGFTSLLGSGQKTKKTRSLMHHSLLEKNRIS